MPQVTLIVGEVFRIRGNDRVHFQRRGSQYVLLTFPDSMDVEILDEDPLDQVKVVPREPSDRTPFRLNG